MQVRIEKLVYGGAGIARTDEGVLFVPKVLPGELVEVEIVDRRKDYAHTRLTGVIEPSPHRRPPTCPNFETVGCCNWSHIAYESQLEIKETIIQESLSRLGQIEWNGPLERITGTPHGYRLRASFHVAGHRLGFVQEKTHAVVPITECAALMPELNSFIRNANEALLKPQLQATEAVRVIVSPTTGEVEAIFRGPRLRAEWSERLPRTRVMGIEYRLRPDSFFQPNRYLLEGMGKQVVDAADGKGIALDLFCGSGFFSLLMARKASKVIGIDRRSIANAKWNARHNKISNVEFVKVSAGSFLMKSTVRPDTVVLDPPRTGAGRSIVRNVVSLEPRRVIYVSCNPTTFAPEARRILDGGYRLTTLKFVDQFPGTHHIETVAVFDRP